MSEKMMYLLIGLALGYFVGPRIAGAIGGAMNRG